jgi:hypothetical protein
MERKKKKKNTLNLVILGCMFHKASERKYMDPLHFMFHNFTVKLQFKDIFNIIFKILNNMTTRLDVINKI